MQVEVKNTGKTPEQMVAELQAFKQRLPADIGNMAVRFFKDNITERQGFLNTSLELWQKGDSRFCGNASDCLNQDLQDFF